MKNLFAIPRLSLPETFTILITLVVCLVGFTNAEVYSNHRKRNPNQREKENFLIQTTSFRGSVPYSHEKSKISNELEQKKFASLRDLTESSLERLFNTHSDYLGESEDADSERESDGYGYDDDEYYHFNSKRNDDANGSKENIKSEKEDAGETNKETLHNDNIYHSKHKEADKEGETIEMLNFKECHSGGKNTNTKPLSDEAQKKQVGPDMGSSLKMSDFRESSAIDEKVKDRKDSGGGLDNNQKLMNTKNEPNSGGKDSVKLKDIKLSQDPEKREKESALKDMKETVASKNLKEDSNASEGKEKNVKLNENVKLEESVNKVDSKNKEPAKIVKNEEDISNYRDKLNEDDLSEINSRANFMGNDYRESVEALKTAGTDEEENNSYEVGRMDKSSDLEDRQEVRPFRERMRKQENVRENYGGERLEASNRRDAKMSEAVQDKNSFLRRSNKYDSSNLNPKDIFKKSQFWRDGGLRDAKSRHQQNSLQQKAELDQNSQESQDMMTPLDVTQNQPTQNSVFDSVVTNPFALNYAELNPELNNFGRGCVKPLKKLKGFGEKSRSLVPDYSNTDSLVKSRHDRLEPQDAKNRGSISPSAMSEGKGKIHNKYSNNKRSVQDDSVFQVKRSLVHPRELKKEISSIKNSKSGSDGQNREEEEESSRLKRKSPQKFEYEIKVINQNKDDARGLDRVSQYGFRRVEKDLKSKLAGGGGKYLKKYPYSQVSRDDITGLRKMKESENYIKIKRWAPIVKRHDKKSNIQTRAVPNGYYGNRVKFGQKSLNRNNEKVNTDHSRYDGNDPFSDNNQAQRSREIKDEDFKHDPMKRFDEGGTPNKGNSLLLIKKDERTSKSFEEGVAPISNENDYNSDALAKILAKDSDFLVLKKTDNNKFQKISENTNGPNAQADSSNNQPLKSFGEEEDQKNKAKQALFKKGLQTRSFHFDKEDKKYATNLHGSSSKSNLKKTFDKFRDLAGFFKDNEQEPADNPVREVKEGRDIVFSEDKLPDPIVISSDPGDKYSNQFKTKPQNSIYSISTNFKALDQQEKKKEFQNFDSHNFFSSSGKGDTSEYSWEPALKSIFPEAKSINSTIRNGNEIIFLDLNRNQLRREHMSHPLVKQNTKQPYAPFGSTAQLPVINSQFPTNSQFSIPNQLSNNHLVLPNGNRKIQMILEDGGGIQLDPSNRPNADKSNKAHDRKGYTLLTTGGNDAKIIVPSSDTSNFSSLLKNILEKSSYKAVSKKSLDGTAENQVSEQYNKFLRDLGELSEVRGKESKKQAFLDRRNSHVGRFNYNTIKQLPHGDDAMKYLGSILQNIIANNEPQLEGDKDENFAPESFQPKEGSSSAYSQESPDGSTDHWSSDDEESGEASSIAGHKDESVPQEEGSAGLRGEMCDPMNENNSEDELLEDLAVTSDKILRLRREGKKKRKSKVVERALSHGEKHQSASQNLKTEEASQSSSDRSFLDSKQPQRARGDNGNESNRMAKLKEEEASKGSSDVKTRFETHLKELIEGLNENKSQKEQLFVPNEGAWRRKKRKDTRRRKRSTWSDVKNKVSTTAVQNTILKNLAEDNYHSVYSPGIKRRLLSTDIEAEDADSYSDENERDKNVIAEEPQSKCVKNSLNECVDPMIIELLKDDAEEEKDRARRSLTSDFHSDFKREIDLDESMPNDFQNFLVTSLGAFGSQKREVVKKDEALGEGKESYPDGYNRVVDGGKESSEDSALEKREVSSDDNQKLSSYSRYYKSDGFADSYLAPLMKMEGEDMLEDQSSLKSKAPELIDEKLPTHIRIQITNANRKEKKSSKPALEESDTAPAEVESLPEEQEFRDRSKLNSLRRNNPSKLRHSSVSKFNYNELEDGDYQDNQDNGVKEVSYHTNKRRQKKKKFTSDTSLNPESDLTELNHKAMESFSRGIVAETNLIDDHTTQKSAISNHLPQVETVYNPTQGTNKAQIGPGRFTKTNSISNKNAETARSNLNASDRSRLAEGFLRSYLKEKADNFKSPKLRDFEDWKYPSSLKGMRPNVDFNVKNLNPENPLGSVTEATPFFSSHKQRFYFQKHNPLSMSNYYFHPFPKETISPNNLYDALRLRQELKNRNAANRDRQNQKILQKTNHMSNFIQQESREKSQNSVPAVGSMKSLNFTANKNFYQGYSSTNSNEYPSPTFRPNTEGNSNKMMLSKRYDADEKSPFLDTTQGLPKDDSKEQDYLEGLEEDYGEEDKEGQPANDEEGAKNVPKEATKILQDPAHSNIFNYKLPDIDDGVSEDDEEVEEDYEENAEEELDDFTPLAQKEMGAVEGEERYQSAALPAANPLSPFSLQNQKDSLQEAEGKFASPHTEAKFGSKFQYRDPVERDSEPLCKSSSLLKKVNENANIFGQNLMQNLYARGYDNSFQGFDKMQKQEMERFHEYPTKGNKLKKRKLEVHRNLKRSRKPPEIGTRVYYASRTKVRDSDVLSPPIPLEKIIPHRSINYRLTKEHFLDAEFAGPGNDYENESEEKGKYFNQINFAKNGLSQKVLKERNAEEEGKETEDVKENPEDHGETISDDNILENVIGKYIMRKTVKASTGQASKRSVNKEKSREKRRHKRRKRSAEYPERMPTVKVVRRRLSSGHLTENNFRKYHKKNLTRKRQVPGVESVPRRASFLDQSPFESENEKESQTHTKRSALDLLKKLTNKDRDKKAETPIDSRTAGFEPLSPYKDEKSPAPTERAINQDRKLIGDLVQALPKSSLEEPKLPFANVAFMSKEPSIEKKKNKVMIKEGALQRMQGPWKIELNDKCESQISEEPLTGIEMGLNKLADMNMEPKGLKAFLVIGKSPKFVTIEEPILTASGSNLKEVGSRSYRSNFEEGRGISNKYFRKRHLKSSVDRMKSGYGGAEKTSTKLTEKAQNLQAEYTKRGLHEANSLAEGGSSQPSQGLQRNSKMSFVLTMTAADKVVEMSTNMYNLTTQCYNQLTKTNDQPKTPRLLSKGRLLKRKSAFPPSNPAKIIRDSRHVNEETSEYLGQQVVNAILSHVSANPRFKDVIAPGLAARAPTYKQESYDKDSTLQQADVSNQLQYFLQRFMYDLEKLAEKRVKKRTCNQIDKQAKQFLEFLLAVPTADGKTKSSKEDICPVPAILPTVGDDENEQSTHYYNVPTTECTTESRLRTQTPVECTTHTTKPQTECVTDYVPECTTEHRPKPSTTECVPEYKAEHRPPKPPPVADNSYRDLKAEIDSLRKKCCLLLKLIVDYQNLSKLEKEILDSKYHSIMLQLDRINKEIKAAKNGQEECPDDHTASSDDFLCCGYKVEKNRHFKNFTHDNQISCFQTPESTRGSTYSRNKKAKECQMKKLPKLYFEEMKNPEEPDVSTTTCIPVFENVNVGKVSELLTESKGKSHTAFEVAPPTTLGPNSFDLLLISNVSKGHDCSKLSPTTKTPTTCEHPTPLPICTSCPRALATGRDSQHIFMNSFSPVTSGSNTQSHSGQQEARKERKKFAPHLPRRRKKRSIRKRESEFKRPEGSTKGSEDNYEEGYRGWSSLSAARQILNSLESGFEFDDLLFQKPKIMKKWRRGEKKPD